MVVETRVQSQEREWSGMNNAVILDMDQGLDHMHKADG